MTLTYEDLTEPERALWDAVNAGAMVSLPLSGPAAESSAEGFSWGEDRQIRARVLLQLATGRTGQKKARPRAQSG